MKDVLAAISEHEEEIEDLLDQLGYDFKDIVFLTEQVGNDELLWHAYFREEDDEGFKLDDDHYLEAGSSPEKALLAGIADLKSQFEDDEDEDEDDDD